jgi:hypothetical protein
MGAEFNCEKITADNKSDCVGKVKELIEICKFNYGHGGYSGTFAEAKGCKFGDYVSNNELDAYNWLIDNCKKWGPAVIVPSREDSKTYYVGAWCSS